MRAAIGVDTSCYVTSVALADEKGKVLYNGRAPLVVKQGGLGLRQQEAVFAHIKNLPGLCREAFDMGRQAGLDVCAAGVSDAPRRVENSYMPVFLAGVCQAEGMASALGIPLLRYSHQQGHLRAAEQGNPVPEKYIGVHLSGGTSEILAVDKNGYACEILGGSTDISAGQLIDRIGVLLGMDFPAGRQVEQLAMEAGNEQDVHFDPLKSSVKGCDFSFSGAESECRRRIERGADTASICRAILECIADTLIRALDNAREMSGLEAVLVGGGVAANDLIRQRIQKRLPAKFAQAEYAGDNAAGIALLAIEDYLRSKQT